MHMTCARWISVKQLVGDKMNWVLFLYFTLEHWFFPVKLVNVKKNTWNSWARLGVHMMWRSVRKQHPCQLSGEWHVWVAEAPCVKALECGLKEHCSTRGKRYCSTLWLRREKLIDLLDSFEKNCFSPHPQRQTLEACSLGSVEGLSTMCFYLLYLNRNFKKKPVCSGQKHRDS